MASEFQRRKITGLFRAMDVDGDGLLDESDFRTLTDRWLRLRGGEPGSPGHVTLTTIMMGWWTTLRAAADQDHEGKVAPDDVLVQVDLLVDMSGAMTSTANAMFDAVDENGDGRVSAREYRQMIEAWRGTPADTDEIFPLLDLDGDGHLSRQEFVELWIEFWTGDDPTAPGTWVFGKFELQPTG